MQTTILSTSAFVAHVMDRFHKGGELDIELRPIPDGFVIVSHFWDEEVILSSSRTPHEARVFKSLDTAWKLVTEILPRQEIRVFEIGIGET